MASSNPNSPTDVLGNPGRSNKESIINREALDERVQEARESARTMFNRSKEKAQEWEEGFEDYVRERPIKSLLFAVGVGLIVGVFVGRR